jgi:hypothetical protein
VEQNAPTKESQPVVTPGALETRSGELTRPELLFLAAFGAAIRAVAYALFRKRVRS